MTNALTRSTSCAFRPLIFFTGACHFLRQDRHGVMMSRRRVTSVLGCLLLLLSVVVDRSSSGFAWAAVSPSEASSSSLHPQACDVSVNLASSQAFILDFLKTHESSNKTFHIQGWRWHTLSLARDARRLWRLASRLIMQDSTFHTEGKTLLDKAVYHVFEFNMKALHRIENEIFFPWLRAQLTSVNDPSLAESFQLVLDDVIEHQQMVSKLGSDVLRQKEVACGLTFTDSERHESLGHIADMSADLASRTRHIMKLEDTFLVPAVAILTPVSQQRTFNNKVIRSLGIFDSRVHLVGMYDAVLELGEDEQELFQQEIPAIPRYMIPRWKRLLYDPQAGVLQEAQ